MCVTKKGPSTFQLPDEIDLTFNTANGKGAASVDAYNQSRSPFPVDDSNKQQQPTDGIVCNTSARYLKQLETAAAPTLQLQNSYFAKIAVNQQLPLETHKFTLSTIPDFPTPISNTPVTLSATTNNFIDPFETPVPVKVPKNPKKRRRRHQKPGLTAKKQTRQFVAHNYHDHANDPPAGTFLDATATQGGDSLPKKKGGVAEPFPFKLHRVLDQIKADGLAHIMGWQIHGRAFKIYDVNAFMTKIMPKYFGQKKLTSFQRQLNLYGFLRLTRGRDDGAYYSELFLRGKEHLCHDMTRKRVKGTKYKAASNPNSEPDFYQMPFIVVFEQQSHGAKLLQQPTTTTTTTGKSHHYDTNNSTSFLLPGSRTATRAELFPNNYNVPKSLLSRSMKQPAAEIHRSSGPTNMNDMTFRMGEVPPASMIMATIPQGSQINLSMPMMSMSSRYAYTASSNIDIGDCNNPNTPFYSSNSNRNNNNNNLAGGTALLPNAAVLPNFDGGGGSYMKTLPPNNFFGLDPFVPNVAEPDLLHNNVVAQQHQHQYNYNYNYSQGGFCAYMQSAAAAAGYANANANANDWNNNTVVSSRACSSSEMKNHYGIVMDPNEESAPASVTATEISSTGSSSCSSSSGSGEDCFLGAEMEDFVELYHPDLLKGTTTSTSDAADACTTTTSSGSSCGQSSSGGDENTYYGV